MRNDFSAVQVHDNVEVQVYACYAGFEIGDVPDPNLVGCSCCMHWLRLTFRSPRSASVVELPIGLEDADSRSIQMQCICLYQPRRG